MFDAIEFEYTDGAAPDFYDLFVLPLIKDIFD